VAPGGVILIDVRATGAPILPRTLRERRAGLATRLRARLPDLEASVAARVFAISEPREITDPEYLQGLRNSLSAALGYALETIERGEGRAPAVPPALLTQARMAGRHGVSLDTVLRRYFAGYALLSEFVIQEAEDGQLLQDATLQEIVRGQGALFDRLIVAVSEEHRRESQATTRSSEQRRAERIERLLDGEMVETSELNYDLGLFHVGLVAHGPEAADTIRALATRMDKRLLLVRRPDESVWAWLGSGRPRDLGTEIPELERSGITVALGEPSGDVNGWRLTHRQAKATLPIALRGRESVVRYADVALLASILEDDLLTTSLPALFLAPLEHQRDGGDEAQRTLRAYLDAGFNVSSAAAALGVNRNTVASRIRGMEATLGRPLAACAAELEVALRLDEALR